MNSEDKRCMNCQILRKALCWYAEIRNFKAYVTNDFDCPALSDGGFRARRALRELQDCQCGEELDNVELD